MPYKFGILVDDGIFHANAFQIAETRGGTRSQMVHVKGEIPLTQCASGS